MTMVQVTEPVALRHRGVSPGRPWPAPSEGRIWRCNQLRQQPKQRYPHCSSFIRPDDREPMGCQCVPVPQRRREPSPLLRMSLRQRGHV